MIYFVYILKSKINSDIYVGSTENVERRTAQHNSGRVRSTKVNKPWVIMEQRRCGTRSEAVKLEMFLKTGQQKESLRKKYVAK